MKQILYDFIYPHSALAFVFCSCIVALAHTHIDERDGQRERILKEGMKIQKNVAQESKFRVVV